MSWMTLAVGVLLLVAGWLCLNHGDPYPDPVQSWPWVIAGGAVFVCGLLTLVLFMMQISRAAV